MCRMGERVAQTIRMEIDKEQKKRKEVCKETPDDETELEETEEDQPAAKKAKPSSSIQIMGDVDFKTHDNVNQQKQIEIGTISIIDQKNYGFIKPNHIVIRWLLQWSDDSFNNHYVVLGYNNRAKLIDGLVFKNRRTQQINFAPFALGRSSFLPFLEPNTDYTMSVMIGLRDTRMDGRDGDTETGSGSAENDNGSSSSLANLLYEEYKQGTATDLTIYTTHKGGHLARKIHWTVFRPRLPGFRVLVEMERKFKKEKAEAEFQLVDHVQHPDSLDRFIQLVYLRALPALPRVFMDVFVDLYTICHKYCASDLVKLLLTGASGILMVYPDLITRGFILELRKVVDPPNSLRQALSKYVAAHPQILGELMWDSHAVEPPVQQPPSASFSSSSSSASASAAAAVTVAPLDE